VALVIPSLKLIAVRNGGALETGPGARRARERWFFDPLMDALRDAE
jgi:hypothetical protein